MTGKRPSPLVLLALALSGAAGLIDQVCWIRLSGLLFGSTGHALSTVLAVFFLGLALGSAAFGRLAGRIRRPLRAAAFLELGLGALVLLTPFGFAAVDGLFGQAYRAAGGDTPGLWAARAGLIALVLLPPAFLMGGTLPLFARQLVADPKRIGASIAGLYATNTLGAAAGALATGFVLLPALGTAASLGLAAALNAAAAAALFAVAARAPALEPLGEAAGADEAIEARVARVVVTVLVFVTGFVALGQEVLWARFLAAVVGHGVHTVALTLTIVLVGIVLGSALAARFADRDVARGRAIALLAIGGAVTTWTLFHLPAAFWRGWGSEAATAAVLMLPASILAGASFPLAVRVATARPEWAGTRLGTLLAANTLGGIVGALVIGFVVLPAQGIGGALVFCTVPGLFAGGLAWSLLSKGDAGHAPRIALAAAVAVMALVPFVTRTRLPDDLLGEPGRVLAVVEGVESNLAVVRGPVGERVLEIDRWWQGQDAKTHQVMAAHLPLLLHPAPRRVLVVGVGAGQTPARFAMEPGLEALDCVDIEPRVFDVIRAEFPHAWMADPRVRLLATDGRNHVLHAAERYDVISLEVGQLFRPGAASFYTLEFYRAARARLLPGGLLSQFVPLPFLHAPELASIVATFRAVFPEATLWYNTSELLLIGAAGPAAPGLDSTRVAAALADSTVARDLAFSLWGGPARWWSRPEVLAAAQIAGPAELAALSAGGRIDRDDRPLLAYATTRPRGEERRELTLLPLLRAHLAPLASAEAAAIREENLAEIAASATLRGVEGARASGDVAGMTALLQKAIATHPGNVRARRMLGDALLLAGRNVEAESTYVAALAIAPDDARTHGGLGLVCLVGGRIDESVAHYRTALAAAEVDDADWRNNLGAGLVRQRDLPGALAEFERALVLRPEWAEARRNADAVRGAIAQRGDRAR